MKFDYIVELKVLFNPGTVFTQLNCFLKHHFNVIGDFDSISQDVASSFFFFCFVDFFLILFLFVYFFM